MRMLAIAFTALATPALAQTPLLTPAELRGLYRPASLIRRQAA